MELSNKLKLTVKVKVCFEDAPLRFQPKGNNIVVLEDGISICLGKDFLEKNNASSIEFYNKIQATAKSLSSYGYDEIELVDSSTYSWDKEAVYSFSQGLFKINGSVELKFPQDINNDKKFLKQLEVIQWLRNTVNLTGEQLTPLSYEHEIKKLIKIVKDYGDISYEVIKGQALVDNNMVGLITVGKGSVNEPCMYVLSYNGMDANNDEIKVGIVGKGITFDTGGYSLKPSEYMKSMHSDMAGSATVAAVLALYAIEGGKDNVKAYMCCAENMVSGCSMRIGDILSYPNGVSVIIDNTDAEGRLVLADGLIKASNECEYVVDMATLTGAAKMALGRDYNAILSLNDTLAHKVVESSKNVYERAWQLPFEEFHKDIVKSELADVTNSASGESIAGTTCAAAFLSNFVTKEKQANWVHVDLSAAYQKASNKLYNVGAKGVGARMVCNFIQSF